MMNFAKSVSPKNSALTFLFTLLFSAEIHSAQQPLTIMTLNTYAWPEKINEATKQLLKNQLASGITKPIGKRVDEMGSFIKQKNPDIVVFQELWGINNKKRMIKALGCTKGFPFINQERFDCENGAQYRYHFMDDTSNLDYVKTKSLVDSGLLISSKFPIAWHKRIVFPEKLGEEKYANKGALLVLVEGPNKKPIFIVDSHLQSGLDLEEIRVRDRQMHQIARELAQAIRNSKLEDYRVLILGDFNDPIKYSYNDKRLIDRTSYMIDALRSEGINVSNEQVKNILIKDLGAQEVVHVNELKREGTVFSTTTGEKLRSLDNNDPLVQRLSGAYIEGSYFKFATDNGGNQLLDQIFIDDRSKLLNYQVFRKEVLSDPGIGGISSGSRWDGKEAIQKTYNPDTALSDHAAVMATISY